MYSNMTIDELENLLNTDKATITELTGDSRYIITVEFDETIPIEEITSTCRALKVVLKDIGAYKVAIVPIQNRFIRELGIYKVTD